MKTAKRVGLALGSGDMRGMAHIGVLQVLEEEGGNRRRTAERLGISRTTLWRILERS